ncbi:MAG: GTP-binding protein [Sulfurimonas sp. RIFOXYD12_FULL_33_39]|uniref:putative glycoside hydrolase n=1 Tax=unclassified Sulfurimonas TaxID=2623549 RepID=UPI0008B60A2E|nr:MULTISPECIES: putative glycoside hydrolase [unclassified Sulfurimonas]OHE09393.1 MAG: GTP-binding protein [Sulfurimonas sp. RIFOXYD12_FULL_33_39]OHE12825.1 MAG: GTP-binding protein [Sulfurimonas sp. RIFOXYD2_FULL_34_21]
MKHSIFISFLLSTTLFASFSGAIVDKTNSLPIANATVSDSNNSIKSNKDGLFTIDSSDKSLSIKACGYRPYKLTLENNTTNIKLEPIAVKALYLTFWGANLNSKTIKKILDIVDATEVNAIVVDVKNEYGSTSYKTSCNEANSYGAAKKRTIKDIKSFISLMKSKNIYTIARIVTFKDELQSSNNFVYAIKDKNKNLWKNHDEMGWVDPFDTRSHEYTASIAEDAANVGFDEINFDYIRFPAKAELTLAKESNEANRIKAIENFLSLVQKKLQKYPTFISVSTYGNICWETGDTGIGQKIESLAKYADYIAPMLYPSGFAKGSFNFEHPSEHPHAVIYRSIKNIENKIDSKRIRPWLQSFRDYAHKKREYKKFEIGEQIRATKDINTSGWMMWSPSSKYDINCFKREKSASTLDSTL